MEPYRRDNGRWYARIGGRRISLGLPRGATLTQARRRAAQLLLDANTPAAADEITHAPVMLSGLWALYIDVRGADKAPRTVAAWRYRHGQIKAIWGDRDCREITPLDCERLRAALLAKFETWTVIGALVTLKTVLKFGVQHGYLDSSPAADLKVPKPSSDAWDWYTRSESELFLRAASKVAAYYVHLLELALLTGLRRMELTEMVWGQVDFNSGSVRLTGKGGAVAHLPLSTRAQEILKAQREVSMLRGERVFPAVRGKGPISGSVLGDVMKRCAAAAGLRAIRFHDLRHSFCSQLLNAGVDIKTVSELARHKQISTTASVYGHLLLSTKRDALEVLVQDDQSQETRRAQ